MTDRIVYTCRDCNNAVVSNHTPPIFACPCCGNDDQENWSLEGQIR